MASSGADFAGGRELSEVRQKWPALGHLWDKAIDTINRGFQNAGVSPTGETAAPKAPDSVSVKTSGELMHIAISHTGPIQRGIRYFTEISTNPQFNQPLVIDHGTSRTSHPISLPTMDDNGNMQPYYVQSYAQNPGSQPSEKTIVGGVGSPTAFMMGGSTNMTLLPSTGSGTAPNSGQHAGSGLGKVLTRTS